MKIDPVRKLFRSKNRAVRIRAAKLLVQHEDAPLSVILEILDEKLGVRVEPILLRRTDPGIIEAMMCRLRSTDPLMREVACTILGRKGGPNVTQALERALEDEFFMVRRAAAFGLAHLHDPSCIPQLVKRYSESAHDDINVRAALECALKEFGVAFVEHPEPVRTLKEALSETFRAK